MLLKNFGLLFRNVSRSVRRQTTQPALHCCSATKICYHKNIPQKTIGLLKLRHYSSSSEKSDDNETTRSNKLQSGIGKYKVFADYDSPVILDIDEERQLRLEKPELFEQEEVREDEFAGLNLERGINGVFDIEELVDILRKEKAKNICVVSVPPEYQYVDHMVIASGKSLKHLTAMAEFIRKLYKRKKAESDYFPIIEGKKSDDWMAIDLGNIALHFQTKECRKKFDIEMLWSLGPEFDDKINQKEDEYITLLKQHSALQDLEPLDVISSNQSDSSRKDDANNSLA
ncbi:uncharacterized protein 312 [Planococcus citri]|uniref:uncharacterized protein 312 n=1 Tax=Planococcus citri TaxID=170843 RepID=UPI0031F7D5CD